MQKHKWFKMEFHRWSKGVGSKGFQYESKSMNTDYVTLKGPSPRPGYLCLSESRIHEVGREKKESSLLELLAIHKDKGNFVLKNSSSKFQCKQRLSQDWKQTTEQRWGDGKRLFSWEKEDQMGRRLREYKSATSWASSHPFGLS